MKRLRRWLFNLAAAVSLGVCIAGIVLWLVIPYAPMSLGLKRWSQPHFYRGDMIDVFSVRSGLRANITLSPAHVIPRSSEGMWNFCGFWFQRFDPGPGRPMMVIVIPAWFFLLLMTTVPARWAFLFCGPWRTERRLQRGACPRCGYDLRATPERCPECGTIPKG